VKQIIVVNGIHASGKSTLAQALAKAVPGLKYFHEIGGELRQQVQFNALASVEAFDQEVMRRELSRDCKLVALRETPVVETWHIGNMAYVATRSPQLLGQYRKILAEQLRSFHPFGIIVHITRESFLRRYSEHIAPSQLNELIEFYDRILDMTHSLYREYNVPYVSVENNGTVEEALLAIREGLAAHGLDHEIRKNKEG